MEESQNQLKAGVITRKLLQFFDLDIEVEYEVGGDEIIFRDKETIPPTEVAFPLREIDGLAKWLKELGFLKGE